MREEQKETERERERGVRVFEYMYDLLHIAKLQKSLSLSDLATDHIVWIVL